MQGLLARLVCRYAREAARSAGFAKAREGRHPHRIAGDEPMSPGILWGCRACGAQRRVPGNSPAALERACGRWGPKGRRRGSLPLAASAGPATSALGAREAARQRQRPRWALPGGLAGWRFGDARDLTRSRGFAAADSGGRLHFSASVVEVHVAARRLRRIVPLGIRPNETIRLRGERPSSGSTRPFELSPGVFIMRKAVAAIRRRNTLSAVSLAIQKPAGQANNPAYRRLKCFFVLTKGMSAVGPRPTADIPLPMLARHPHRCSDRLGAPERARLYSASIQSSSLSSSVSTSWEISCGGDGSVSGRGASLSIGAIRHLLDQMRCGWIRSLFAAIGHRRQSLATFCRT